MVLRHCSIEKCRNPAERNRGSCMICAKHLCSDHITSEFHGCPSIEDEPETFSTAYNAAKERYLAALLDKIDVKALEATASKAHGGIPCQIPALSRNTRPGDRLGLASSQCGGQNCNLDINFADGTTWLARIRLEDPLLPPPEVQTAILLSEAATLEFLAGTRVPAPRVYGYDLKSSPGNKVGVSYVLMEKLPGRPLDWGAVGAEQRLNTLANGEVDALPVDNYLSFLWRLSVLPQLVSESQSRSGPFYLKHYDDKGDHILVDEYFNITGIIDWEFASAEAKELALSSPCMMWPVNDFYDGGNALSEDEVSFACIFEKRGYGDLAETLRKGRPWQRYLFFMGGGIPGDMAEFEPLFQGLRRSFVQSMAGDDEGRGSPAMWMSPYHNWKQEVWAELVESDSRLRVLSSGKGIRRPRTSSI